LDSTQRGQEADYPLKTAEQPKNRRTEDLPVCDQRPSPSQQRGPSRVRSGRSSVPPGRTLGGLPRHRHRRAMALRPRAEMDSELSHGVAHGNPHSHSRSHSHNHCNSHSHLVARSSPRQADHCHSRSSLERRSESPAPEEMRVLAVDDNNIDRKLIEMLLKTSSFKVTAVKNAIRALEVLGLSGSGDHSPVRRKVSLIPRFAFSQFPSRSLDE
jgi:hypothetical protein